MSYKFAVVLDSLPTSSSFVHRFFPAGYTDKDMADELVEDVIEKGGMAHVVPQSQFTDELIRQLGVEFQVLKGCFYMGCGRVGN